MKLCVFRNLHPLLKNTARSRKIDYKFDRKLDFKGANFLSRLEIFTKLGNGEKDVPGLVLLVMKMGKNSQSNLHIKQYFQEAC